MSELLKINDIQNKIYTIRGVQVMVDDDLAEIYGVETKRLNEQVRRNADRFPHQFMLQLSSEEIEILRPQIATSSWGGRRTPPYVFTEQGVAMLSAVLRSETAVKVSIQINVMSVNDGDFNYGEFALIKIQAGLNSYKISVKEWVAKIEELLNSFVKYNDLIWNKTRHVIPSGTAPGRVVPYTGDFYG